MRFLTIFPELNAPGHGRALLSKDVGAIPYYLAELCNWHTAIAYLSTWGCLSDARYEQKVQLLPIGSAGNKVYQAVQLIAFITKQAKRYSVVNFYHDSLRTLIYAFVYKLFNRSAIIYVKLDMDHVSASKIMSRNMSRMFTMLLKHLISAFAVDLYTVETTLIYETIRQHYHYRSRLRLLPNGFSPDDYRSAYCGDSTEKKNIILTAGRLGLHQKHNELLVNAIARIDRELLRGWTVVFAGRIVNPAFQEHIERTMQKHPHLKQLFVFTGHIEDKNVLYDMYRQSKIFCLTSRWESFGLVISEAMYFGNYVISSDLPASRDLTLQGTIGALFPVEDEQRLVELIVEAISGRIDLAHSARVSHEHIKKNYDWRILIQQLEKSILSVGPDQCTTS